MEYVGLVGCGKRKKMQRCLARDMYTGGPTASAIRWVRSNFSHWRILSAKYGVLHPEQAIDPYDLSLDDLTEVQRLRWGQQVRQQLLKDFPNATFVGLAKKAYFDAAQLPEKQLIRLLEGINGQGVRMRWLLDHPVFDPKNLGSEEESPPISGTTPIRSLFMDSGAFTQWTASLKYHKEHKCGRWDFYSAPAFWEYLDNYAKFIKKYNWGIDYYANVDVIPHAELTYRNQKYLEEKHGLHPVPVVHFGTDLKWLHRYLDEGYSYIGIGGLVGSSGKKECRDWLDSAFNLICSTPNRLPKVRTHGFAMTSFELMRRWPWWSVDSATWEKVGSFGGIYVPQKRGGGFVFDRRPTQITISLDSPGKKIPGKHYLHCSTAERKIVQEWLEELQVPLGKVDGQGTVIEHGVMTRHIERKIVNLHYFERFRKALPPYPWPFYPTKRASLGIFHKGRGK